MLHRCAGHAHVVGLFGKRGSGKSCTLGTLLEGVCTKERKTTIADNSRAVATLLFDTLGIFQWIDIALDEKSQKETVQHQFAARRGWDLKSEPLDVAIWIPRGTREPNRSMRNTVDRYLQQHVSQALLKAALICI